MAKLEKGRIMVSNRPVVKAFSTDERPSETRRNLQAYLESIG